MAETDVFPDIGWDYPLDVPSLDGVLRQRAQDGTPFSRIVRPDLRVFELVRRAATTDQREQLVAFYRQHQDQFFRFDHKVWINDAGTLRPRSFPVVFDGPPEIGLAHNDAWPISVRLVEAARKPLLGQYLLWPKAMDNAAWIKIEGSVTNVNAFQDPDGIYTAEAMAPGAGATDTHIYQLTSLPPLIPVQKFKIKVWLQVAVGSLSMPVRLINQALATLASVSAGITTGWQEFTVLATAGAGTTSVGLMIGGSNTWVEADGAIRINDARLFYDQVVGGYPDPDLGHDSFFIEEDDSKRAAVLSGTWSTVVEDARHGGSSKFNTNLNTSDAFQFTYAGYGFRFWSIRKSDLGIGELFLDGTSLGTLSFYNATQVNSAPIFTKLDVPLGLHRVELRATNTKQVASSGKNIVADAVEVMI